MKQCHIRGCRRLQTTCTECGRVVCEKIIPTRQDWIRYCKQFPKEYQECWVAHYIASGDKEAGHCYSFATYYKHEFRNFGNDRVIDHVTHWMPLPDGPED